MAFSEDLSVFFDTDDFAVTATLNGVASGNVIIDREFLLSVGVVANSSNAALAIASEYAASCIGGTLAADDDSYKIRARRLLDDGRTVVLELEAA